MTAVFQDSALLQGRNAAINAPTGGATVGPQQNAPGAGIMTPSPTAAPSTIIGHAKTQAIDVRGAKNMDLCGSFYKTTATGAAATAPAGTWGLEVSADGNLFTKVGTADGETTPAAITMAAEGDAHLIHTNMPFAYVQGRFIYSGAVTGLGTLVTAPTAAAGNGLSIKMSPDGLFIFLGLAATGFLAAYPVSPTTGILSGSAIVPGVALAGNCNALDVIGPFQGQYYVLVALASSPYGGIIPFGAVAAAFGTIVPVPAALAGAALSCAWATNNAANPTNQIAVIGATGQWAAYSFNANTGQINSTLNLLTDNNGVAITQPGANINGLAFSCDGSMLYTAESTTPYMHGYPFSAANAKPLSAPMANPSVLPGQATTAVAVHPSGEGVAYTTTTTVLAYPVYFNASGSPFKTLPRWGAQKSNAVAGGTVSSLCFSADGGKLLVGGGTTPFATLYPWADIATGLGTLFTAISGGNIPAGAVKGVCAHPNNGWFYATHTTTPFCIGWPDASVIEIFAKITTKAD